MGVLADSNRFDAVHELVAFGCSGAALLFHLLCVDI